MAPQCFESLIEEIFASGCAEELNRLELRAREYLF